MKNFFAGMFVAAVLLGLSGCSVNVIVAPHATLAVESDLGQSVSVAPSCATDGDVLICQ